MWVSVLMIRPVMCMRLPMIYESISTWMISSETSMTLLASPLATESFATSTESQTMRNTLFSLIVMTNGVPDKFYKEKATGSEKSNTKRSLNNRKKIRITNPLSSEDRSREGGNYSWGGEGKRRKKGSDMSEGSKENLSIQISFWPRKRWVRKWMLWEVSPLNQHRILWKCSLLSVLNWIKITGKNWKRSTDSLKTLFSEFGWIQSAHSLTCVMN